MSYAVYYQRFFGLLRPGETRLRWLDVTHRLVKQVRAEGLDEVYCQMQGEVWSPNGEARGLIRSLGLSHTSLSVGDVVKDPQGNFWVCNVSGWLPLRSKQVRPGPRPESEPASLWLAIEADLQVGYPQITRLKITDERDCLPPEAYSVERCGRIAFADLVALAKLLEQRRGLPVCIDLGEDFYETEL
jgi:hypothetical protein